MASCRMRFLLPVLALLIEQATALSSLAFSFSPKLLHLKDPLIVSSPLRFPAGSPFLLPAAGVSSKPAGCRSSVSSLMMKSVQVPDTAAGTVLTRSPRSAYIHIPFCKQKCFYCDFPVRVIGKDVSSPRATATISDYLKALSVELQDGGYGGFTESRSIQTVSSLDTIFIGGGTPSLLEPRQLEMILSLLDKRFGIASGAEISVEMDPGTFDEAKARAFRLAGVNRASMGVQSFQEEQLAVCGRGHGVSEVIKGVEDLRKAGLEDISMDLMSGLPGDTLETFTNTLKRAVELEPTHLSVYDLIVEEGTAFGAWYDSADWIKQAEERRKKRGAASSPLSGPNVVPLPDEDIVADMYRTAHQTLTEAGYEHYEISNYAKLSKGMKVNPEAEEDGSRSPYRCRHNLIYWKHDPFLAFGMGATSFACGGRLARPRTLPEYIGWVQRGGRQQELTGFQEEPEDAEGSFGNLVEAFMVGLRMRHGLDLKEVEEEHGSVNLERAMDALTPHMNSGLLEVTGGGRLRLASPEGFLFSNSVLVSLFSL